MHTDLMLTLHLYSQRKTYRTCQILANVQSLYNGEPEEILSDIEINETKVMKKLMSLNPTKAPGDDGIILIRHSGRASGFRSKGPEFETTSAISRLGQFHSPHFACVFRKKQGK